MRSITHDTEVTFIMGSQKDLEELDQTKITQLTVQYCTMPPKYSGSPSERVNTV